MPAEREIGILIRMKYAAQELRKAERDIKAFARDAKRHFDVLKTGLQMMWTGRIFGGLLNASKELNEEWTKWKKNVMDAGVADSMRTLGQSVALLVTGFEDSNKSAKELSETIAQIIDVVGLIPIGVQAIIDRVSVTRNFALATTGGVMATFLKRFGYDEAGSAAAAAGQGFLDKYQKQQAALEGGYAPANEIEKKLRDFQNALDAQNSQKNITKETTESLNQQVEPVEKVLAAMRLIVSMEDVRLSMVRETTRLAERQKVVFEAQQLAYKGMYDVATTLGNELLRVYDDWIEGSLKPAKEYLKQIVAEIGRMAAKAAIETAINVGFKAIGSAMFSGGGVVRGGMSLPSYAGGEIVSGPRAAMIGDNPERMEAVVPMRNRKIPVEIQGGGGKVEQYQITINAVDGDSVRRLLFANREALRGAIQQLRKENPNV